MVAASDPLAVDAGLEMLRAGGSAIDAAIAVELTLGLVEPESSGVGGGGFLIHYSGDGAKIDAYDGREWAPAGATPDMFLSRMASRLPFELAQASGKSIGTPALIPMLKLVHEHHGKLPWAKLFEPAIRLAEDGFVVGPRLSQKSRDVEGPAGGRSAGACDLSRCSGQAVATGPCAEESGVCEDAARDCGERSGRTDTWSDRGRGRCGGADGSRARER